MGGNAFTDLLTPRLPHELYELIRAQCHQALQPFYEDVITPAEAPSKVDHGDIDFLVAQPKQDKNGRIAAGSTVAAALGASKFKHTPNSKTTQFAVPLPKAHMVAGSEDTDGLYAQVDVHVVPDPAFLAWELFLVSYGDLVQILGILNRPIGLTANDRGLYLRIPEIEPGNRKKAMIFLTDSPSEMMSFLHLDEDVYNTGFATNEDIFRWCLQGVLYSEPKAKEETSNDRQRLKKRGMFISCIREFVPEHAAEIFPPSRRVWTREEVLKEALRTFPTAQAPYDAALAENRRVLFEASVLADMRVVGEALGASEKEITELIRGSKRFVEYDERIGFAISDTQGAERAVSEMPEWMQYVKTDEDKSKLLIWIKDNWRTVHEKERRRMNALKK
jgi:hypothetical protein